MSVFLHELECARSNTTLKTFLGGMFVDARYVVDIYEQDVPGKFKMEIVHGPQNEARIEVIKLRQLWEEWDR